MQSLVKLVRNALSNLAQPFSARDFDNFDAGVAAYERGDYATAYKEFRPLAEQGHADAQNNLGLMYELGLGVPQDDEEAVRWYRKATELGHAGAQYNLGVMYNQGRGVPQSNVVAYALYDLSAANGHNIAKQERDRVSKNMTDEEIAAAQALTRELSKPGNFSKALDAATRK